MKIVLASPLYPPDIAEPAPYVKELASRLASHHEVVIVTYGRLPEPVQGVRIRAIDKRLILPVRLFLYTVALWQESKNAVLYVQNGASVELPAILVHWHSKRLVVGVSDARAHQRAKHSRMLGAITRAIQQRAAGVVDHIPTPRPEILPFAPRPTEALAAWEQGWDTHVRMLETHYA